MMVVMINSNKQVITDRSETDSTSKEKHPTSDSETFGKLKKQSVGSITPINIHIVRRF